MAGEFVNAGSACDGALSSSAHADRDAGAGADEGAEDDFWGRAGEGGPARLWVGLRDRLAARGGPEAKDPTEVGDPSGLPPAPAEPDLEEQRRQGAEEQERRYQPETSPDEEHLRRIFEEVIPKGDEGRWIAYLFRKGVKDRELAHDVLIDAVLKFAKRVPPGGRLTGKLPPLWYVILDRTSIDQLRRQERRRALSLDSGGAEGESLEDSRIAADGDDPFARCDQCEAIAEWVREVAAALPPEHGRLLLALYDALRQDESLGESLSEVARRLRDSEASSFRSVGSNALRVKIQRLVKLVGKSEVRPITAKHFPELAC